LRIRFGGFLRTLYATQICFRLLTGAYLLTSKCTCSSDRTGWRYVRATINGL